MNYQTHRNLPPLAGICGFAEAMKPGLPVEECVRRLKRMHYAFRRLHEIFIARLTAEPVYELKMAFSLHAHYCAEHATALRTRVGEMREPPLGLETAPHESLAILFDEILSAPGTEALLLGIYEIVLPALDAAIETHAGATNLLADHPTFRVLRFARVELEEMLRYGRAAVGQLVSGEQRQAQSDWLRLLADCLRGAGGLDEASPCESRPMKRLHSRQPFVFTGAPRRDARFPDPYNMGVNAEVFLYDPRFPPDAKVLMMFYKRLREIDVPEMMAGILAETPGKPWAYYRDMTRQLWDEARHAMMGEAGFVHLGIDWSRWVMVNFTWSLGLNTQLTPRERHAVLYFIEQGLMSRTGKRFEWEVGRASGDPLAALFQDYDWADEVLHARIGRDWYISEIGDAKRAVEYGDECWSKVMPGWRRWRDEGLTRHRNWWPELYAEACRVRGVTPDEQVLAYSISYEDVRADLKNLASSA